MRTLALTTLIISGLIFAGGFIVWFLLGPLGAALITDLDRAGAINHEAINQSFPEYSENLRGSLGQAITKPHLDTLFIFLCVGLVSSSVGTLAILMERKNRK